MMVIYYCLDVRLVVFLNKDRLIREMVGMMINGLIKCRNRLIILLKLMMILKIDEIMMVF